MHNIRFNYLYRDAGNYKKSASVVFSNPTGLVPKAAEKVLKDALTQDGLFVAHQIRIPDAFLFDQGGATSDDHCFHELDSVEASLRVPNDRHSRSISEFIDEVRIEAKRGWIVFDPHDRLPTGDV
jgi:hypothetical protein